MMRGVFPNVVLTCFLPLRAGATNKVYDLFPNYIVKYNTCDLTSAYSTFSELSLF